MTTERTDEIVPLPTWREVLRRSASTPHTTVWNDHVVPLLRWTVGGSADDVALIVLGLGAVKP